MEKKEDNSQMIDNPHGQSFDIETTKPSTPRGVFKSNAKISQSSNLQASFTLFKGFIGTGILALPYSFNTAGLGLSIIVIIIVAVLTTRCFILLLDVADEQIDNDKISLPKLTLQILGNRGKQAVQASMLVMQLGCCIGIIIFTKNFLNHVICEFGIASLCDNTAFSLFFCLALTVPLSMINNMHYFYIPSLAANFFILIGLASQMYYNTQVIHENPELKSNFTSYLGDFHWTKLPLFFGVATFAFEGIGIIFSIRGSMEKPKDFSFLLKNQMVILCLIYLIFPTVCLIAFGDRLPDIIFLTLPTDDPFYLLVQILYGISALLSYPVQLFPALRIMENSKLLRFRLFNERGKCINKKLRYGMRMGVIGLVFLVAFLANSFHLFLNLLGSCVFTFVGFILPVWIYHTHFKGRIKIGTKIVNYTMLVISTFFGVVGSVMSVIKMVSHDSNGGGIHG